MRTHLIIGTAVALWAQQDLVAQHSHGEHAAPKSDSAQMVGAADAAMSGTMSPAARTHMRLTPARPATTQDTARALDVVHALRAALAPYGDTAAATAAGYRMFMPHVKVQKIYHFTNYRLAIAEAFRFDPAKPTSLLYQRGRDGTLQLIGAMYTAPRRMRPSQLDERIPLSIARWHQHVNWCLPKRGEADRWMERRDSLPLFGPESPIDTRTDCEDVGGRFYPAVLGWMIHANVFAGDDMATIFGHGH